MGFKISKGSYIFLGCKFDCANNLFLGKNSVINSGCRLDNRGGLDIGENVSISSDVIILTADHDMDTPDFAGRNKKVIIDDYVWVGTRAMILPGVSIRKGALVAAGAIVTKDVSEFSVVGGVPARFIKNRPRNLNYDASYFRLLQ